MKSPVIPIFIAIDRTIRNCDISIDFEGSIDVMADGFCEHDNHQMVPIDNVDISIFSSSASQDFRLFLENCKDGNNTVFIGYDNYEVKDFISYFNFIDNRNLK